MKILLVSPFLPFPGVPHAGGKLLHYLLSILSKRHSVHMVTRYYPGEERHFPGLRRGLSGLDVVPADGPVESSSPRSILRTVRSYIRLARQADIAARRERFDLCHVENTETGYFWEPPADLPAALTCVDIIAKPAYRRYDGSHGLKRVAAFVAWKMKHALERRAVSRYRTVFTLSEEDREWANRLYPEARVQVLRYPGGIDHVGLPRQEVPGRVLFVGALQRPLNIQYLRYLAEKVWPDVRREVPGGELLVVGGGLPVKERELLSGIPGVRLTGFVEDLESEYKSTSVFAAPILTGGGVIVKILDAMAAGVPVVTTSFGNEVIRAEAGKDILVADSPEDFARALVMLLKDPEVRNAVAERGKRHLATYFSEEGLIRTLEAAYQELLSESVKP
jgi:glycosyltransferase involved in cell wall biosynthesis